MKTSCIRFSAAVGLLALASLVGAEEHPARASRLVTTIDGIRIEYSPGQEAYLRPIAAQITAWNQELDQLQARASCETRPPLPLSPRDLRANRAAILQQIAAGIGLAAPTPFQERCYDTMLSYYEFLDLFNRELSDAATKAAGTHDFAIWQKAELVRRLSSGEIIPGFTYDPKTRKGSFSSSFQRPPSALSTEREELSARFEQQRLDHSFNYRTDSQGLGQISASFTYDPQKPAEAPVKDVSGKPLAACNDGIRERADAVAALTWPVIITDEDAGRSPDEVAEDLVKGLRGLVNHAAAMANYRDPNIALVVLHETTESGLVEHYIGSADRRWLCEGTANFVAWKIARDHAGAEFARQVYDLDGQLAEFAALQKKIDLRRWPAVEHQREGDRNTPLTQAHYAFATRALFLFAQANGEDALPRLFREIGQTPRADASMKTVTKAYRKVTGARLEALIKTAEENPIPSPSK